MFAVPGWSVSASQLKTQQEPKSEKGDHAASANGNAATEEKKSKKRKRGQGNINGTSVTTENVAELWQKHIEGIHSKSRAEEGAKPGKGRKKRRRKEKGDGQGSSKEGKGAQDSQNGDSILSVNGTEVKGRNGASQVFTESPSSPKHGKSRSEQRKAEAERKAQLPKGGALPLSKIPESNTIKSLQPVPKPTSSSQPTSNSTTTLTIPPAPPPIPQTNAKLTPLQTAMRAKLISARFRHINQTLYTTPSTQASSLFSSNPEAFASYHAGFRAQVASWPQNPVDIFVQEINRRGAVAGPKSQKQLFREEKKQKGRKKSKEKPPAEAQIEEGVKVDPLPRSSTTRTCTILDLGCGDGSLHASLLPYTSYLNLSIHSYDLSQGDGPNARLITVSDIAHLPVTDSSADIAILCLALMGTNWVDFVSEAARVVRVGGECWVAEVRSRFVGVQEVKKTVAVKGEKGNKKKKKTGGEEDDGDMLNEKIRVEEEEIAGKKAKEQETDVGPFVEVFRRRGFVLKGVVDWSNKMFVRMRFLRVRDPPSAGSIRERGGQPHGLSKVIDKDDDVEIDPEEEAKVLKPCLYKTR
ncbi:MAG: hypothetical protein LQ338_001175 [Usnochroma carphineum]|nr:MAG: hypothetical protein LQ338_001175 [Usnochroma carphineum]